MPGKWVCVGCVVWAPLTAQIAIVPPSTRDIAVEDYVDRLADPQTAGAALDELVVDEQPDLAAEVGVYAFRRSEANARRAATMLFRRLGPRASGQLRALTSLVEEVSLSEAARIVRAITDSVSDDVGTGKLRDREIEVIGGKLRAAMQLPVDEVRTRSVRDLTVALHALSTRVRYTGTAKSALRIARRSVAFQRTFAIQNLLREGLRVEDVDDDPTKHLDLLEVGKLRAGSSTTLAGARHAVSRADDLFLPALGAFFENVAPEKTELHANAWWLLHGDETRRVQAAWVLGNHESYDAARALVRGLDDPSRRVVLEVLAGLERVQATISNTEVGEFVQVVRDDEEHRSRWRELATHLIGARETR